MKVDISLICQDLQKLQERVKNSETRLSGVEDAIPPLLSLIVCSFKSASWYKKKDVIEKRHWRCNLRFIGLPEGAEGREPTMFLEKLLFTYSCKAFSPTFAIERAHRMRARPPPPGAHPRTFIAKLLNYKDCDAAL